MISLFIKSYKYRFKKIFLYLISSILLFGVFAFVFKTNINKSDEINVSYSNYNFNYGYVLNYESNLKDELIYSDTSIQFFKDDQMKCKINATSIMKKNVEKYDLNLFSFELLDSSNKCSVPHNVATRYGISLNSSIYALFPDRNGLVSLEVVEISNDNYDLTELGLKNDVGLIAMGYDEHFVTNIVSKFCIFSENSVSQEISFYPQILKSTFHKTLFLDYSKKLATLPVTTFIIVSFLQLILYFLLINLPTHKKLIILAKKGLSQRKIFFFEFAEIVLLYFFVGSIFFMISLLTFAKFDLFIFLNVFLPVFLSFALFSLLKTVIFNIWSGIYGIIKI